MTVISEPLIGLEQIQRAFLYQLMENVNGAIGEIENWMALSDEELANRRGVPFAPTLIERVDPQNFVEGHRPSLIDAPIDNYPNIAVWAVRGAPSPESESLDQLSVYSDTIFVEILVKSQESEEEVNRRIQRTVEAVNIAIAQDRSLGGLVTGLDGDPVVDLSDVFTRKERTSYGPHWFWQGARLEYAVRKEAVYPSSSAGSIFRTPSFDIDQA